MQSRLLFVQRVLPGGEQLARKLHVPPGKLKLYKEGVWVENAWIEAAIDEKWLAAARLTVDPATGHVVVSEVRIFPREREPAGGQAGMWSAEVLGSRATVQSGGITSRLLRKVRLSEYPAHATTVITKWLQHHPSLTTAFVQTGLPGVRVKLETRPRPERGTGRPDRFYAELANEYVTRVAEGSRRPVREIAARRRETPPHVRDMLHEARARGLLSAGDPGRRGGHLMPRAIALLKTAAGGQRKTTRKEKRR